MNVMLDLETMGINPNAPIVAIGAVTEKHETFYLTIYPEGEFDGSTILWWLTQNKEARLGIAKPMATLKNALLQFREWLPPDSIVWGNGSDFDNVILASAYQRCEIPLPWKYYNNRCYRTMKKMFPNIKPSYKNAGKHNALNDAQYQMNHLKVILERINA